MDILSAGERSERFWFWGLVVLVLGFWGFVDYMCEVLGQVWSFSTLFSVRNQCSGTTSAGERSERFLFWGLGVLVFGVLGFSYLYF